VTRHNTNAHNYDVKFFIVLFWEEGIGVGYCSLERDPRSFIPIPTLFYETLMP